MNSEKQSTLLAKIQLAKDTKKSLRFLTAYGLITGYIDDSVEPTNDAITLESAMIHTVHISSLQSMKALTIFIDQIIAVDLF